MPAPFRFLTVGVVLGMTLCASTAHADEPVDPAPAQPPSTQPPSTQPPSTQPPPAEPANKTAPARTDEGSTQRRAPASGPTAAPAANPRQPASRPAASLPAPRQPVPRPAAPHPAAPRPAPPYGPPHAPPGYAPPGYAPYPAPGYGPYYPPAYPAPPPEPAKPKPPGVIPGWDPASPPPEGYELRSAPNGGLLGLGISMLALGWGASSAAVPVVARDEDEQGIDGDGVEGGDWLPLLIPVAGPFVTIYSVNASPELTGLLVVDGVVQTAGLGLILMGALMRKYRAVRVQEARIEVTPLAGNGHGGVSVQGVF